MKNPELIRERYLKEPFNMRLGHLASDLARIPAFLENSMNMNAIKDILEESKFFIEWLAPEASFNIQELLSEIQLKLALWHRHLIDKKEDPVEINELKKMAKNWSRQLMEFSGLLVAK